MGTYTKEHIQNNIIIIINKFRPGSRFTLRNMRTTVYRIEPTRSRLLITPTVSLHIITV
ncbi:hypothetical protein DET57_114107 [Klebsiella oxytoca]|uniref:Uncharacterized protein n=1 Tax=Klebsiella oxytoca TaxID=571 RepID=A0A318FGH2_KLEOX|nr:hypothetical protein DET57_114107 [Klebsiella oxytoca]